MLPKFYRFHIVNNTGSTATFDDAAALSLRIMQWKFDTDGSLVYNTVVVDDMGFGAGETILNGASVTSSDFDNSSNLFLGLNGVLVAIHDLDAALGRWDLFMTGTDIASQFPDSKDDFDIEQDATFVASLRVDNQGVDRSNAMDFALE